MASRRAVAIALEAVRAQRALLDARLAPRMLSLTRRAWESEQDYMRRILVRHSRGRPSRPIEPYDAAQLAGAVGRHMTGIVQRVIGATAEQAASTVMQSLRSAARLVGLSRGSAVPDEERIIGPLATVRQRTLTDLRVRSLRGFGVEMDGALRQGLMLMPNGEATVGQAIDAVGARMSAATWQLERIVRTETNYAFNSSQADAVRALQRAVPGLRQRWTELVDDLTGQKLDDRVANDSLVMHGQVVRAGGSFIMPPDPRAPSRMVGMSWSHPPNRPNDRAVITPWARSWGVPGWEWRDGMRAQLT